jgi:hypothetical protein
MTALHLAAIASFNLAALCSFAQSGALTHRYSFTVDASDSVGTASGTLIGGATIVSGALVLNGVNGFVSLPPSLVASYTSITIETWVTDNGSGSWARIFDFGNNTGGAGAQGTGTEYMFLSLPAGTGNLRGAYTAAGGGAEQIMQWPNNGRPAVGRKTHIVWATDGHTSLGRLYADNVLVASNIDMTLTPAAIGATLNDWIGRSQWTGDAYFKGSFDEFRIYNFALSAAQIQGDFRLGPNLASPIAMVTVSPSNTVYAGTTVIFDLTTTGAPPFQYQWRSNLVNIPGATNSALVLANAATSDSGSYDLVISNSFGSSNSPSITLTVNPPAAPTFATEPTPPASTNYVEGLTTFSAMVVGSPPITLQWQHQGINIPGATATQLALANLSTNDAGSYTLLASNAFGANLSTVATLTVLPPPGGVEPNVLTSRYDNARTGANTNEFLLTPANVNVNTFGRLFTCSVDGYIYTQPLYVANLAIPGQGTHNVVFVATEHDTVYAFDADSNLGTNGGLLWQTNLGISILSDNREFGTRYAAQYPDLIPDVGITGTPVIDPAAGTIYMDVVTRARLEQRPIIFTASTP